MGGGGTLLEAAVCFAAVKSHIGNVGKTSETDAGCLRRSRGLDGGGGGTLLVTLGILC